MEEFLLSINDLSLKEMAEKKLHHRKDHFFNPFNPEGPAGFSKVLRWKLFSQNPHKSLYHNEKVRLVKIDWEPIQEYNGCSVTFIKHSCVMIKDADKYILVDPLFWGSFWAKDFSPLAFDLRNMPNPDHILVTHGHYDHLDTRSLKHFPKHTHIISPLGYESVFKDLKLSHRTQLDWFDSYNDGIREIILLPCNHWTMRNPFFGPNGSLWGAFLLKGASGKTIFITGDTAYFDGFKELGETYSIDLAIISLGAYEPRWMMANSHLNPAEAVKAFQELKARHMMIVHWGSFRLGDEPVYLPPLDVKAEMEKQGILPQLIHLDHGQTLFYNDMKVV